MTNVTAFNKNNFETKINVLSENVVQIVKTDSNNVEYSAFVCSWRDAGNAACRDAQPVFLQ